LSYFRDRVAVVAGDSLPVRARSLTEPSAEMAGRFGTRRDAAILKVDIYLVGAGRLHFFGTHHRRTHFAGSKPASLPGGNRGATTGNSAAQPASCRSPG
jgi:hypothetical protein